MLSNSITGKSLVPVDINPFSSFWMAGYECSDKLNKSGQRVDLLQITGHMPLINEDYRDLKPFGIRTVREGIRWSQVEKKPYHYDWSVLKTMLESGKANGIQQVWDICHFGFPDDLTPFHPQFAKRFAALCKAFVHFYRSIYTNDTLIVTPVNEVSFLAWLGGESGGTSPYCRGQGWEVKYALMRAYIQGIAAMREIDPAIRILTTEPLVQMVPPLNPTQEELENAAAAHEEQYQAVDILSGRMCPELGGKPEYLDILGLNFYYNNQWVDGTHQFLKWYNDDSDPRWKPLGSLLTEAYNRFQRPIVLTETSHSGEHRPNWLGYITGQCVAVIRQAIPLWGVCLYPIIDRPDWDLLHLWHGSGLWDAVLSHDAPPKRVLHQPYADELVRSQALVKAAVAAAQQKPFPNGAVHNTLPAISMQQAI